MNINVILLIFTAVLLKILLLFSSPNRFVLNPDEEGNYRIAQNYINGKGYSIYDTSVKEYKPTSFHGSFSIFIYKLLIQNGITKKSWVYFIFILTVLLYGASIYYFHKFCVLFLKNDLLALLSTITYSFYPSIIYFIGSLFFYENLVLPILVIVVYRLMAAANGAFAKFDFLTLPLAVAISCLLRAQLIAVYALVFLVFSIIIIKQKRVKMAFPVLLSLVLTAIVHIPLLMKNKNQFGVYILSTQSGFEFLQGHNPTARGSWMGNWQKPESELYQYAHSEINNLKSLNEYEESEARKKLGINWIINNPLSEFKLGLRKLILFFIPQNFEVLDGYKIFNPINMLVHIFFICYFIGMILYKKMINDVAIIISPIIGSILLSIVFFVGYRWRYYSEPFMIILAWRFILDLKSKFHKWKLRDFHF